jgi:hypothetical protein
MDATDQYSSSSGKGQDRWEMIGGKKSQENDDVEKYIS